MVVWAFGRAWGLRGGPWLWRFCVGAPGRNYPVTGWYCKVSIFFDYKACGKIFFGFRANGVFKFPTKLFGSFSCTHICTSLRVVCRAWCPIAPVCICRRISDDFFEQATRHFGWYFGRSQTFITRGFVWQKQGLFFLKTLRLRRQGKKMTAEALFVDAK